MRFICLIVFTVIFSTFSLSSQKRLPFQSENILPVELRESSFQDIVTFLDAHFEGQTLEYDEEGRLIDNDYLKYRRWQHDWYYRLGPDGDFPDMELEDNIVKEKIKWSQRPVHKNFENDWTAMGPFSRSGLYWGMGRVMAIDFHPTDAQTFYVGAAKGGIWVTNDGGQSYKSLGDDLPYNSVTNLLVNKNNPKHITISLGDRSGWWDYSIGIYHSFDGGKSWAPSNFTFDLSNEWTIFDMKAHPQNSDWILVASGDGVYKSEDGINFEKITFVFPEPNFSSFYPVNIEFHPTNDSIAYLSWFSYWDDKGAIYRTLDKGNNWHRIEPDGSIENRTRITLATTPAAPDKLAAKYDINGERFLYTSEDKGETWQKRPRHDDMDGNILYMSPLNPDIIYSGYFYVWGSFDSGASFDKISAWDINNMHVDQWFIKHNPVNNLVYWCNDGGVYSFNEFTSKWTELNNTLAITQMYDISVAQDYPGVFTMGSQDNGGAQYNEVFGEWTNTNGGDGMTQAMNPNNFENFFTSYPLGILYRTTNSYLTNDQISDNMPAGYAGDADWLSPYCLNPLSPNEIYAASENLYYSEDQGDNWVLLKENIAFNQLVKKIEMSEADGQTLYCFGRQVLAVSKDKGVTWTDYTINNNNISNIELHPTDPGVIWVTQGGFSDGEKLYRSDNFGRGWNNLSGNLPNIPVRAVFYDDVENDLYVGTEMGVFYSDADNIDWVLMDNGLPFTQINEFELQKETRKLYIATYGRGMYEYQLPKTVSSSNDIITSKINVSPNPATDFFNIDFNTNNIKSVNIYDIKGQLVFTKNTSDKNLNVPTNQWASGVYMIQIQEEKGEPKALKIVVK